MEVCKWYSVVIVFIVFSCSSEEEPIESVFNVQQSFYNESDSDLLFSLEPPAATDRSFDYRFESNSALVGDDFADMSGVLTFPAGASTATIESVLINDVFPELMESFMVIISEDGVETTFEIRITDDDEISADVLEDLGDGLSSPDTYPSMRLIWSDEFDGDELNLDNWTHEIGNGCDQGLCGWGNNELQSYQEENTTLSDGYLTIEANQPSFGGYRSSRIITKGKQEFEHGRIDVRAKLPSGQGLWPAIWMLGSNIDEVGWPTCGEIDIMELVGHEPETVHGTIHFNRDGHVFTGDEYRLSGTDFSQEFHVFSLLWEQGTLKWYVDYELFYSSNSGEVGSTYPFDNDFFFIFNVAVGGNWPGDPDDTTVFPQQMVVDYIRVFQ